MWICKKCGEEIEDVFDSCWKCSTAKDATLAQEPLGKTETQKWRLKYRIFRGTFATWERLFNQATEFANALGPERVVSISHSEDDDDGVVAVWYWDNEDGKTPPGTGAEG